MFRVSSVLLIRNLRRHTLNMAPMKPSPSQGREPASISIQMHPRLQMSALAEYPCLLLWITARANTLGHNRPRRCGVKDLCLTFRGHPENRSLHRHVLVILVDVACVVKEIQYRNFKPVDWEISNSPLFFDVPKSEILHIPSWSIKMLSAFMSRWRIPSPCKYSRPSRICKVKKRMTSSSNCEAVDHQLSHSAGPLRRATTDLAVGPDDASDRSTGNIFEEN